MAGSSNLDNVTNTSLPSFVSSPYALATIATSNVNNVRPISENFNVNNDSNAIDNITSIVNDATPTGMQGRLEKFRAEGQKFRLGPLVSGAPKSSDEQKKRS